VLLWVALVGLQHLGTFCEATGCHHKHQLMARGPCMCAMHGPLNGGSIGPKCIAWSLIGGGAPRHVLQVPSLVEWLIQSAAAGQDVGDVSCNIGILVLVLMWEMHVWLPWQSSQRRACVVIAPFASSAVCALSGPRTASEGVHTHHC